MRERETALSSVSGKFTLITAKCKAAAKRATTLKTGRSAGARRHKEGAGGQELRQGAALAFCLMLITGVNLRGMKCRKRNFECALVYPLSPKATYLPQSPCSLSSTHSFLPLSLPSFCLPTSQLSFLLPVSAFEIKNQHWPRPSPSPVRS